MCCLLTLQIDLSEEPLDENIELCVKYLKRMDKINCVLEMELGITGGEEDGVNNEDVDMEKLYSQPEEVDQVYTALSKVSKNFTIAASFGNVHGVYKPGNVKLAPGFLGKHQAFIKEKHNTTDDTPALLVFHGGSGSTKAEILEAIGHGVIKMNIDTDTRTCSCHSLSLSNLWVWVGDLCAGVAVHGERHALTSVVSSAWFRAVGGTSTAARLSVGNGCADTDWRLSWCSLLCHSRFIAWLPLL